MSRLKTSSADWKQLRAVFDRADQFMGARGVGHKIKTQRAPKHQVATPEWMSSNDDVAKFLERVFPKLNADPRQHKHAARWAFVIETYFRAQNMSRRSIAVQLEVSAATVASIIQHIRRAAEGLRQDGVPRTGRPKGRPRKSPVAPAKPKRPYHRRPPKPTLPVSQEPEFERFDDE
jgi:hypothetical protein